MATENTPQTSRCDKCAFCKWQNVENKRYQVGCSAGQIDKYKALKQRLYPDGDNDNNPIYQYVDGGEAKYYTVRPACVFSKTKDWCDRMIPGMETMSDKDIRNAVFTTLPFLYLLTVAYDGDTKRTLRSIRSTLNSTVKPQIIEIISPYDRAGESKNLNEMLRELRKMWKENEQYQDIKYNIRQIQVQCEYSKSIEIAIEKHRGFFYVLSLEEGVKVHPDFMESIKHKVFDDMLDFHIISLEDQYKSALWAGVLYFGSQFQQSHAFVQDGPNIVQRFDPKYVKNFFPEAC